MSGRRLLLPSAARTAATASVALRNRWHKGLHVVLAVTAASGTGGLTLHIQQVDRDSGNTVDLLVAGAAVTAPGTYAYQIAPGETAAVSGVLVAVGRQLPTDWQVNVAVGDASSYTYSVNGVLLD